MTDQAFQKITIFRAGKEVKSTTRQSVTSLNQAKGTNRKSHNLPFLVRMVMSTVSVTQLYHNLPPGKQIEPAPGDDAAAELVALSCAEELQEVLVVHVDERVQIHIAVGVLAERAVLPALFSHGGCDLW